MATRRELREAMGEGGDFAVAARRVGARGGNADDPRDRAAGAGAGGEATQLQAALAETQAEGGR